MSFIVFSYKQLGISKRICEIEKHSSGYLTFQMHNVGFDKFDVNDFVIVYHHFKITLINGQVFEILRLIFFCESIVKYLFLFVPFPQEKISMLITYFT